MKISKKIWVGLVLLSITSAACSSGGGGGGPVAVPTTDNIAAIDNTLNKAEEDLVSSGQVEQDAVDAEAPQETL